MRKFKSGLLTIVLCALVLTPLFNATAVDNRTVVVKTGDWINYKAVVTGTPDANDNVTGATVNFTSVEGSVMHLYVVTQFTNGSLWPESVTLNLTKGVLGDDFVIPVNMSVGDQFYDTNQGNITISSIGTLMIAGAQRTVVSAHVVPTVYYWDRVTGVLVMANSTNTDFEMDTTMAATNIWQPAAQAAPWYKQTVLYIAIGIVIFLVVMVTAVVFEQRKKAKR